MADPIANNTPNQDINQKKKIWSWWVFGWGEDIFDNEELFHPIDTSKTHNEQNNNDIESHNFDINLDEVEDTESKDNHQVDFDPIFDEEDGDGKAQESDDVDNNTTSKTNKNLNNQIDVQQEDETQEVEETNEEEVEAETEDEEEIISEEENIDETPKVFVQANKKNVNKPQVSNTQDIDTEIDWDQENTIDQKDQDEEAIISDEKKMEMEPANKSDLIQKFDELVNKTTQLYDTAGMDDDDYIQLIGGNNGKSSINYNLRLIKEEDQNDRILISKIETDNDSSLQEQNNLHLKKNDGSLQIILDEVLLYDEVQDLQDDDNKKMQVVDKLNKFIFLVGEELKIYERDQKEKQRMEQERRKLRDIFRNF